MARFQNFANFYVNGHDEKEIEKYLLKNGKLNIIEDKIKFQSEINEIVVAPVKNSQTKIEKRIKFRSRVRMFPSVTNI